MKEKLISSWYKNFMKSFKTALSESFKTPFLKATTKAKFLVFYFSLILLSFVLLIRNWEWK